MGCLKLYVVLTYFIIFENVFQLSLDNFLGPQLATELYCSPLLFDTTECYQTSSNPTHLYYAALAQIANYQGKARQVL